MERHLLLRAGENVAIRHHGRRQLYESSNARAASAGGLVSGSTLTSGGKRVAIEADAAAGAIGVSVAALAPVGTTAPSTAVSAVYVSRAALRSAFIARAATVFP